MHVCHNIPAVCPPRVLNLICVWVVIIQQPYWLSHTATVEPIIFLILLADLNTLQYFMMMLIRTVLVVTKSHGNTHSTVPMRWFNMIQTVKPITAPVVLVPTWITDLHTISRGRNDWPHTQPPWHHDLVRSSTLTGNRIRQWCWSRFRCNAIHTSWSALECIAQHWRAAETRPNQPARRGTCSEVKYAATAWSATPTNKNVKWRHYIISSIFRSTWILLDNTQQQQTNKHKQ